MCRACGVDIRLDELFCARCGQVLGLRPARPLARTSAFRIYAATTLTPAIKKHLYGYKFYRRRDALPLLADLLIHHWRQLAEESSAVGYSAPIRPERVLVLPIPPHSGKNSLVTPLAARFARGFDYDCRPRALHWVREVQPQHTLLNHRERLRNIARSLGAERECLTGYRRIIIVDDLTTTGATLREAVRAVRQADGRDGLPVDVVTLAVSAITRGEQGSSN
jgi:predicted amidophosphoribosyltransferase